MSVANAWTRIVSWCQQHAPATAAAIRQPASPSEVTAVEAVLAQRWPNDLRQWFTLADGTAPTPAGYILPGYRPLPLDSVRVEAEVRRQGRDRLVAQVATAPADPLAARFGSSTGGAMYDLRRLTANPAGTPAGLFLSDFVPIAEDQAGSVLVVDLRDGPQSGCVTEFVKGDADARGPAWSSVAAMLEAVAVALTTREKVGDWRPQAVEGRLDWGFELES